jgi:hypothetical protein
MKERPTLFSPPMSKAIRGNLKDITRRALSPRYIINEEPARYKFHGLDDNGAALFEDLKPEITPWIAPIPCPYGKVGDVLYVRELYYDYGLWDENGHTKTGKRKWKFNSLIPSSADIRYAENPPDDVKPNSYRKLGWYKRLGRFMPYRYVRTKLEIVSIRVERLHDITPDDADREGVESWNEDYTSEEGALHADYANYLWVNKKGHPEYHFPSFPNPIDSFRSLWIKINGQESWDSNPWVWRIEFEKL